MVDFRHADNPVPFSGMLKNAWIAEVDRLKAELFNAYAAAKKLMLSKAALKAENAVLLASNRDLIERIIKEPIPEDIRGFVYVVTSHLQCSREKTPAQMDAMFQRAYKLYCKYDVEGRKSNKKEKWL